MDDVNIAAGVPQAVWLARAALAWRARVVERAMRFEPEHAHACFGLPVAAWRRAGRAERVAWLATACSATPSVAMFDVPATRLALLTQQQLARVVLARALFARVHALRRCIDANRLDWFDTQAGAGVVHRLLTMRENAVAHIEPLLTDDAPLSAWLADGWRRVRSDPSFGPAVPLVTLSLPAGVDTCVVDPPYDGLGAMFFARLPELFPELTWLFGCEAMKATSASTPT
ncbi:TPA: hypothetical protein QDC06_006857 [Burkholderia cepacia]|nr:hypothetical protein BZY94_36940 [Burkholderia territorii]HDR9503517.1 hypothetical protein [Burkholderia cepacia]